MDLPKPPDEHELKNIIDKLANFVARNGPEFEQMTKHKQKDNPRFSFLFGGEHFNYYQYKVTTEQAIINQQKQKMAQQQISQMPQTTWPPNTQSMPQIQQLTQQLENHKKQAEDSIKQSEQNLAAQYQTMIQTQQTHIDEAIASAREEKLQQLCEETRVTMVDLNFMAQPIIDSCTKDAISNGKNWIFLHNQTRAHSDAIAQYLLNRILGKDATFELKLHLIYLINDVLHHCRRKNAEDLRLALESIVIPVFCSAYSGVESDKQQKLNKLLTLWEQNKYFDTSTLEQLRDPNTALSTYQANLITEHAPVVTKITSDVNSRYTQLQKQHQDFVGHLQNQLQTFTQQIKSQISALQSGPPPTVPSTSSVVVPPSVGPNASAPSGIPSSGSQPSGISLPPPGVITQIPPVGGPPPRIPGAPPFPPHNFSHPPPNFSQPPPGFGPPPGGMPPSMTGGPPGPTGPPPQPFEFGHGQGPPVVQDYNHGKAVSSAPPPRMPLPLPDLSKPPPGFPPGPPPSVTAPITDMDLTPSVPYHELPAGLMAPLVKLEDSDYEPIDPRDMRLPPPQPPSERLLAAVEAFYSPPSHDRPVDSEGWEKLGLFEFFKAKQKAKKLTQGRGPRKSPQMSRSVSRSPSPRRRRRRSRSPSPAPYQRRSRSRSNSPSPSRRDRDRERDNRERSRNREKERSPSPPSFFGEAYYQSGSEVKLGSENKGHQLLSKMGWGGGGLGATEQGIVDPIDHGEVREKMDQYKGIGISVSDPFEQFRKGKSQGFIQRMRARDGN